MYDMTNQISFNNIKGWITQIKQNLDNIEIILLGNKCDCKDLVRVKSAEAQKFADDHHISFIETSSKMNINVTETFLDLTKKLIFKGVGKNSKSFYLKNGNKTDQIKKKNCC